MNYPRTVSPQYPIPRHPPCWAPKPNTKARCAAMMKTRPDARSQTGNWDSTRWCAAHRPQHTSTPTGGPRAATPQGLTAPRARPAQRCAYVWGAVHVGTKRVMSFRYSSSRAPAYAGPRSQRLPHTYASSRQGRGAPLTTSK